MPVDILLAGFPGKSTSHGGLGWSTVALVRHAGHNALIDVGPFGARRFVVAKLAQLGLRPDDVTDVLLTHAHHDHSVNYTLFPNARIAIGRVELEWALTRPDDPPLPEFYVDALAKDPRVVRLDDGDVVIPGITAHRAPGHTPGHLCYVLHDDERDVVFTGDSAKNRAELVSRHVDQTFDGGASYATLDWIWSAWRRRPGNLLVPGHDLPMVLDAAGAPAYVGTRSAAIQAWFGERLDDLTTIDLCR